MILTPQSIIMLIRAYALPTSIFSWLVAFNFGVINGGNILYGIIALVGICFAHLGANVFDDYIDYIFLKKGIDENGKQVLINAQKGKCECLLTGMITKNQMLILAIFLFSVAILTGVFFISKLGFGIIYFMLIGGILGVLYPILGRFRLCELAIGIIYGPLLFSGVYYVMMGYFDYRTLLICVPTMLLTINLLYTDTTLDYDIDKTENKKTLANLFSSKWGSLNFHKVLLSGVYISIISMVYYKLISPYSLLTLITIPAVISLINSMRLNITEPEILPKKLFVDGVMENWNAIVQEGSSKFMFRMYQARNLIMCFSIIFAISLYMK